MIVRGTMRYITRRVCRGIRAELANADKFHIIPILDILRWHTDIGHPQFTSIELLHSNTARFLPRDNRVSVAVKRRKKTRLLGRVETILDGFLASVQVPPRFLR